jgi:hypothetical protein
MAGIDIPDPMDAQRDDVITLNGVNKIVRDVSKVHGTIKVANGRTDPGMWIDPTGFEHVAVTRFN